MRVLAISDTGIIGGPGRGLFQLTRNAPLYGGDIVLCTFKYTKPRSTEFIEFAQKSGFPLCLLRQHFAFDPSALWQACAVYKEQKCDMLQSHGYKAHLAAYAVTKMLGAPWVAWTHGWTTENLKVRLYHQVENCLLKYADAVVAVSKPLYDAAVKLRGDQSTVRLIPNSVDPLEIRGLSGGLEIRKRFAAEPGSVLIGSFGRLSPEKGHAYLLQALAQVFKDFPKAKLLLAGDGPRANHLQKMVQDLGLQGRVVLVGHQTYLRDYYEALDLFVLPSLSEGLPTVVLEAMLMAIPVLATDVGDVKNIIQDGHTGWIVPPGDSTVLAEKLGMLLSNPAALKETASRARAALYPKFCPKERARKVFEFYQQVAAVQAQKNK